MEITEITQEQAAKIDFQPNDVAVIKPFDGSYFDLLKETPGLRIYGPHAVQGSFDVSAGSTCKILPLANACKFRPYPRHAAYTHIRSCLNMKNGSFASTWLAQALA